MADDIVNRLPKNVLQIDCGCLLYVNSPKNHGVTLRCKDHRTKAEIENDEEGLIVKLSWQADEIERLRAEVARLESFLRGHMMLRNPILVAPSCECGLVMEPLLLNTTNFGGPVEWVVDWWCPAYGKIGHKSGNDSND